MLGKGAYGYVNKVNNIAVKKFNKTSHLIQEYTALKYIKDFDYCVHAVDVDYYKLELKMELYDCSLRQWMQNDCTCIDCVNIILTDILKGLVELQTYGLSHSDIKPGNILIKKLPLKAVLGDCGFVSIAKYSKQQRTAQSYRDLVVVNDDKHDMFSFGIVMMELVYKVKPYIKDKYSDYLKIIDKRVTSSQHRKILRRLLNEDRTLRPSASETLDLLYNESYTINKVIVDKKVNIEALYEKYTKHRIINLKNLMVDVTAKLNIKRSKRGYDALLYFLVNNQVKNLNYYAAATLFILASIFGNTPANMNEIFRICQINDHKKVIDHVKKLTVDDTFVKILFY